MRSDYATLSYSREREAKTKRSEYPERGTGPGTSTAGYDGYRQISVDGHRKISGDGHRQISVDRCNIACNRLLLKEFKWVKLREIKYYR
jgi:hypothetical protein